MVPVRDRHESRSQGLNESERIQGSSGIYRLHLPKAKTCTALAREVRPYGPDKEAV